MIETCFCWLCARQASMWPHRRSPNQSGAWGLLLVLLALLGLLALLARHAGKHCCHIVG